MFKATTNVKEFLEKFNVHARRFTFINISRAVFVSHFNTAQNVEIRLPHKRQYLHSRLKIILFQVATITRVNE